MQDLTGHLARIVDAVNCTSMHLRTVWNAAAAAKGDSVEPYIVSMLHGPLHGGAVLVTLQPAPGPATAEPITLEQLQKLQEECGAADTDLADALHALNMALLGCPHLLLPGEGGDAADEDDEDWDDGNGHPESPERWPLKAVSHAEAVADATLSLSFKPAPAAVGEDTGGSSCPGNTSSTPQLVPSPPTTCSPKMLAALEDFNSKLAAAQAALDAACAGAGVAPLRYSLQLLPRGGGGGSGEALPPPPSEVPFRAEPKDHESVQVMWGKAALILTRNVCEVPCTSASV